MSLPLTVEENLKEIETVISKSEGNSERFADTLKRNHIPHLSFSQITSIEFCPYQYYLQYVKLLDPDPEPIYFKKGKVLHQIIASSYQKIKDHAPINTHEYDDLVNCQFSGDHNQHLKNAATVHTHNLWEDCQVVAIEKPFVMITDPRLPPCVGVIDLVIQKDENFIIIDHKTGRDFYQPDVLQMAIYKQYIHTVFGTDKIEFYYDNYRWVNNLDRIRKPAMQRNRIVIPPGYWKEALQRLLNGYAQIKRIIATQSAVKNGECFRCPYRSVC